MSSTATIQKLQANEWVSSDPIFTAGFYRPYEAAVQTAFLMLCAARGELERGEHSVRAITYRLKTPASIRDKLIKKGMPVSAAAAGAALHDIAGLRVVLSSVGAVYAFANLLCASPMAECVLAHDYIAVPKRSGYRSLHLLMYVPVSLDGDCLMTPVEIQLRTAPMDLWASIEHELCYKPAR